MNQWQYERLADVIGVARVNTDIIIYHQHMVRRNRLFQSEVNKPRQNGFVFVPLHLLAPPETCCKPLSGKVAKLHVAYTYVA